MPSPDFLEFLLTFRHLYDKIYSVDKNTKKDWIKNMFRKTSKQNKNMVGKLALIALSALTALTITACGNANTDVSAEDENVANVEQTTSEHTKQSLNDALGEEKAEIASSYIRNNGNDYFAHEWDINTAPNGYLVHGPAIVTYDPEPGEYVYTGLDDLGRTITAYACITPADFTREQGEERETFGSDADKISGWGYNKKVKLHFPSGKEYNGYFYNRSHLIADSLGGTPNRENLITGSRFQNVGENNGGGMGYAETKARKWLETAGADETLYYAVTPVYRDFDELVPRSVYVDMKSSDGEIDEHIEVFNVSGDPAYDINYITGEIIEN